MFTSLICSLALVSMLPFSGSTELECISPEAATAYWTETYGTEDFYPLGWYNGYSDTVFLVEGQTFRYSREIIWHELAHSWDLRKGTEVNGYPSYFSETHTGFSVEAYARLWTLYLGVWPQGEVFPDSVPSRAEYEAMEAAGWLWPVPGAGFHYEAEVSAEEVTIWSVGP